MVVKDVVVYEKQFWKENCLCSDSHPLIIEVNSFGSAEDD